MISVRIRLCGQLKEAILERPLDPYFNSGCCEALVHRGWTLHVSPPWSRVVMIYSSTLRLQLGVHHQS